MLCQVGGVHQFCRTIAFGVVFVMCDVILLISFQAHTL